MVLWDELDHRYHAVIVKQLWSAALELTDVLVGLGLVSWNNELSRDRGIDATYRSQCNNTVTLDSHGHDLLSEAEEHRVMQIRTDQMCSEG